jgi:hypothetical protein
LSTQIKMMPLMAHWLLIVVSNNAHRCCYCRYGCGLVIVVWRAKVGHCRPLRPLISSSSQLPYSLPSLSACPPPLLPLPLPCYPLSPATLIIVSIALAALARALFVTLQLCCHCHPPRVTIAKVITLNAVACLPLVAIAIALAAITLPSCCLPPSSPLPSPLPPSPLPSYLPASLITIVIAHVVAITIAIILVTVNLLPPSLPSLLPPKPLLSLLHSTLVANDIALFVALALVVTHHPDPHRHCLAALALFVTCSHC